MDISALVVRPAFPLEHTQEEYCGRNTVGRIPFGRNTMGGIPCGINTMCEESSMEESCGRGILYVRKPYIEGIPNGRNSELEVLRCRNPIRRKSMTTGMCNWGGYIKSKGDQQDTKLRILLYIVKP